MDPSANVGMTVSVLQENASVCKRATSPRKKLTAKIQSVNTVKVDATVDKNPANALKKSLNYDVR